MLVRPGRWHTYRPDPECGWDERWLVFDGPAARRMFADDAAAPVQDADAGLSAAVEAALVLLEHQPPGFLPEAEACLARALARLALRRARGTPHDPALGRAAVRLQEGPTDIAALARSCRLSPAQFRRRFQAATGHSPRDYAVLVRLERAKELLLVQDVTVAEVADRCGFCSASFFSRIFRRHCGCSPLEWRGRREAAQPLPP
jgi:AraC-like DNA-binding protein